MKPATKRERRSYEAARRSGQLGSQVVYGSRPATDRQLDTIERMARRAGYRRSGDAIRDALGKQPVGGLSRERASTVIDHLAQRLG